MQFNKFSTASNSLDPTVVVSKWKQRRTRIRRQCSI